MKHLVIGADGKIGSALYRELLEGGATVTGTTRRGDGRPKLDFLDVGEVPRCDVAYICAAALRRKIEEPVPFETEVNIIGTLMVIHRLLDDGAFPVFLSSRAIEVRTDAYAQAKAFVEHALTGRNVGIVRLGDVREMRECAQAIIDVGVNKRAGLTVYGGIA